MRDCSRNEGGVAKGRLAALPSSRSFHFQVPVPLFPCRPPGCPVPGSPSLLSRIETFKKSATSPKWHEVLGHLRGCMRLARSYELFASRGQHPRDLAVASSFLLPHCANTGRDCIGSLFLLLPVSVASPAENLSAWADCLPWCQ